MALTDGAYSILTIDDFADQLLNEERVCGQQLPRLTQRRILEQTEGLAKRKSKLAQALDLDEESEDDRPRYVSDSEDERFVSRSPSRSGSEGGERYISKSPEPEDGDRYISRSPSPA